MKKGVFICIFYCEIVVMQIVPFKEKTSFFCFHFFWWFQSGAYLKAQVISFNAAPMAQCGFLG